MENASKALLMAGSILIAILILSLLVLLFQNIGIIPKSIDDSKEVEQLAQFNAQWESYNKKAMYGTDVITVINKAIENNKRYKEYGDAEIYEKYKIDIKIKLTEDLNITQYRYKDGKVDYADSRTKDILYLKKGTYTLLNNEDKITKLTSGAISEKKEITNDFNYTMVYSGFSDFKRRYFKCVGIKYKTDGAVESVTFEQIGTTNYIDN